MTTISLPISNDPAKRAERRVFKYELQVMDYQWVAMPEGAEILCVQAQGGKPCIWALVNPNNPEGARCFRVAGTGHLIAETGRYLGTVQLMGGSLVFHVFEIFREEK